MRRRLRLQLGRGARTACGVLQVVPLPGAGAIYAGWRNPHTRLLRNGMVQALLVVTGSWPLIVPGAVGLGWAVWDAARILQADLAPLPPKEPAA
ncbi:MAG: hypothetical protein QOD77_537 [Thermoplasmata archaeon]|jgi:hypothetical protein|nr:hypothetical protein [Thermoplasmata archaeon]